MKKRSYATLLSTMVFMLGGNPALANGSTSDIGSEVPAGTNSQQDRNITSRIRQELVSNKSLSTRAANVQIFTNQGNVILRGTVNSETEKMEVDRVAKSVAGQSAVKNELQVAK